MKTILVTGGAGFIGSHLCDRLIAAGERVICVDNFFTSTKQNVRHLLDHPQFLFIEHDIIDSLWLDEKIDQVYNLACPASPIHYQKNAVRTIKANTIGMINMLGLAKKHGAIFFQASTSEVYGDPEVHPQPESYRGNVNPVGPRACYDEGKRCAETLCFDYHRSHGLHIKIVRIFNTYGPRMAFDDGRVVSNFIVQALRNEPLTVYGDGSHTRSFCYVDDLVEGFVRMMASEDTVTGPINLGNPEEYTVEALAQKVMHWSHSASSIVYRPLPTDDPTRRRPDIAKAKNILGWWPTVDVDTGLQRTILDFKQRLV